MTQTQFEARKDRAENGVFVTSKTEEGFRVYSTHNPSRMYFISREGDRWTCTCPDFEFHRADTTWRCKHILAVAPWLKTEPEEVPMPENEEIREDPASIKPENEPPPQKAKTRKNSGQQAQMLIKRSVSPDGRIDSVSVEFATPVSELSNGEIKEKAVATMKLQKEIVGSFLLLNGEKAVAQPTPEKQPQPSNVEEPDGRPVPARMIDLGKVNGKWGERFCINFQVNGRRSRLFGSVKQIAGHIAAAGYEMDVENVQEGLRLNLPCRVITKLSDDGKYLNVEQVLPPVRNLNAGGANGRNHN